MANVRALAMEQVEAGNYDHLALLNFFNIVKYHPGLRQAGMLQNKEQQYAEDPNISKDPADRNHPLAFDVLETSQDYNLQSQ